VPNKIAPRKKDVELQSRLLRVDTRQRKKLKFEELEKPGHVIRENLT